MQVKKYRWPVVFVTLGLVAISIALWMKIELSGFQEAESTLLETANKRYAEQVAYDAAAREAVARALADGSIGSLEKAAEVAGTVTDPARRQLLLGTLLPKRIEALGAARDKIITAAADLQATNPDDPEIVRLVEQAKPYEEKALELLKDLDAQTDAMRPLLTPEEFKTWRASMHYLQGYTEFARLTFLSGDEKQKAKEALQKALDAFTKVFIDLPKDSRAEYAIESMKETAKKQQSDADGQKNGSGKKPSLIKRPSGPSSRGTPGRGI